MPRVLRTVAAAILCVFAFGADIVQARDTDTREIVRTWYRLSLELVRHTPTYSPPVASRAFAYLGITAFEAAVGGSDTLRSLGGQLNGLSGIPHRDGRLAYDEATIMQSAMATAVRDLFANTGPTGQRAMAAIEKRLRKQAVDGVDASVIADSEAFGRAIAQHLLAWSRDDGGAIVENMGFPLDHPRIAEPGRWVPTNLVAQQQFPLLPRWGENRTFAMPSGASCPLPPPPSYSEAEGSEFYREAHEVYATVKALTSEQRAIAQFWSDDPMLSPTPPGHWISIGLQVLEVQDEDTDATVDLLARLGVALADAFIGCWHAKFEFDLVRPLTYIRKVIDPKWEAILNTPPFPEYPSGHSTQSGAAAEVLTAAFGEAFAFEDATHEDDGIAPRRYSSFRAAAEEAGISRLYGGIHFRAAIERGLDQGRCIGAYVNALKTRR